MTTTAESLDVFFYASLAKASYCKIKPTEEEPNPSSVNTKEGATAALNDWLGSDSGWNVIEVNGGINGFQAVAYGRDNDGDGIYDDVVIAYRGTDSLLDLAWDDLLIALQIEPTQTQGAINFYQEIKDSASVSESANISITGHSLGGALAQIVGAQTGLTTVTFNTPGMKNNIKFFYIMQDILFCPESERSRSRSSRTYRNSHYEKNLWLSPLSEIQRRCFTAKNF